MAGAFDGELLFAWFGSLFRPRDGFPAAQVRARNRCLCFHDFFWRTVGNDEASFKSCSGAEVAQPICLPKGVFIVFDYQQCIAQIAEFSKGCEQSCIIPLVQTNRWLVKNIHDARESTADLGCKSDALTFAPGKCVCFPVKGKIVQADAVKETQTILNFLDDFRSNEHASFVKWLKDVLVGIGWAVSFRVPSTYQAKCIMNRALANFGKSDATNCDIASCPIQFLSVTFWAVQIGHTGDQSVP